MKFRSIPKVTLQVQVPKEIAEKVGIQAVKDGRPDNETVTRILCIGLGIDPANFGIRFEEPSLAS